MPSTTLAQMPPSSLATNSQILPSYENSQCQKNHLFIASENGGEWLATNLTIFPTCRRLNIDSLDLLREVLPGFITDRTTDLLAMTPHAYRALVGSARTA